MAQPRPARCAGDDDAMSSAAPRTGQVIFLNGISSSGKSSIAEQLLLILDRPFFHLSVDAISGMRARERTLELSPDELAAALARTRAGSAARSPTWHRPA